MKLILLGPPGAGKGTLAGLLKNTLNILHISTGDLLRQEMKDGTQLGLEIKKFVESGQLVPDEVVTKMIEQKVTQKEVFAKGYMLDGYPRTSQQAKDLDNILKKIGQSVDCALYLEATLSIIVQRLTGRRVCRKCGALFHIKNRPSKKAGVCDACGGELYQRSDDNEETIRTRMEVYIESTKPIIEYYHKQKKLVTLNGDNESESLCKDIKKIFNENSKFNTLENK